MKRTIVMLMMAVAVFFLLNGMAKAEPPKANDPVALDLANQIVSGELEKRLQAYCLIKVRGEKVTMDTMLKAMIDTNTEQGTVAQGTEPKYHEMNDCHNSFIIWMSTEVTDARPIQVDRDLDQMVAVASFVAGGQAFPIKFMAQTVGEQVYVEILEADLGTIMDAVIENYNRTH